MVVDDLQDLGPYRLIRFDRKDSSAAAHRPTALGILLQDPQIAAALAVAARLRSFDGEGAVSPTTGTRSGDALGVGFSAADALPTRDLVALQIRMMSVRCAAVSGLMQGSV